VLYLIYLVSSFSVGSLLALAVFVLLVLCCLDVLKLPKPLGTIVIVIPAAIAALLWLDSYLRVMFTDSHGAFATKSFFWMLRDPRQLSSFLMVTISYLLKGVGLALAGVAVTVQPKEKPAPFANGPYAPAGAAQAYAPQYQAPQYQAPQYQQPQYQQPQYQQPQYQQPQYQQPQYQQPQQPQYQQPAAPAAVVCPRCGTQQAPGTKFCARCGQPL